MSKANKGLSTRILTTFPEVQIFHKNPSLNPDRFTIFFPIFSQHIRHIYMLNARRFVNPLSIYRCLILTVSCFYHGTTSCKLYFDERYCLRTPEVGRGQVGSGPLPLMKLGQNKHGNQMPCLPIDDKDFRPLMTIITHF